MLSKSSFFSRFGLYLLLLLTSVTTRYYFSNITPIFLLFGIFFAQIWFTLGNSIDQMVVTINHFTPTAQAPSTNTTTTTTAAPAGYNKVGLYFVPKPQIATSSHFNLTFQFFLFFKLNRYLLSSFLPLTRTHGLLRQLTFTKAADTQLVGKTTYILNHPLSIVSYSVGLICSGILTQSAIRLTRTNLFIILHIYLYRHLFLSSFHLFAIFFYSSFSCIVISLIG